MLNYAKSKEKLGRVEVCDFRNSQKGRSANYGKDIKDTGDSYYEMSIKIGLNNNVIIFQFILWLA